MSNKVKHENPYREGSNYHVGFAFMQRKQVFTRSEVAAEILKAGLSDKADKKDLEGAAIQSATVLLSPRLKDGRGDCRGNLSSKGEFYFVQPLKKIKGEEKKFRLRWRQNVMDRRDYVRPSTIAKAKEVRQEKTSTHKKTRKVAETATA